jgi:precorrin-6A/cobalt-precorrin-6A reductase
MAIYSERATVPRILLLSGTSEGRLLARALLDQGFAVTATVTRAEARQSLFGQLEGELTVEVGGFSEQSLEEFLARGKADVVLDATHPFAARITAIAQRVCSKLEMPYVRYERPDWTPPAGTQFAATFAQAAEVVPALGRRILLTLGARQLKHFAHLHDRAELFARVLPSPLSLEQALAAGFPAERVMCLRPPFSQAFNRALLEEYRIDVLVTKDSGAEGGVIEKVLAAAELGVKVLMIRRPILDGGVFEDVVAVRTIADALDACRQRRDAAGQAHAPQP